MKFAVSNISLTKGNHINQLPFLRPMGVTGLDVSPNHVWSESLPDSRAVSKYRYDIGAANLEVVGLHDLLDGHPELGLFVDADSTAKTVAHLVRLSAICRDLGGRFLVFGSQGRKRGPLNLEQAWSACEDFLDLLLPQIEDHGTILCFDPTGASDADFCVTARECRLLIDHMEHPSLGFELNAKSQVENNDSGHASFAALRGRLDLFHANEPGLAMFGTSGKVDHPDCRRHLAAISFKGWITLQQRASNEPLATLEHSVKVMTDVYLRQDNLSLELLREAAAHSGSPEECGRMKSVLDTLELVRPALINDGGDIELVGMTGDIIRVKLKGACTSCALASQTIGGIRRKLVDVLGIPVRVVPVS